MCIFLDHTSVYLYSSVAGVHFIINDCAAAVTSGYVCPANKILFVLLQFIYIE